MVKRSSRETILHNLGTSEDKDRLSSKTTRRKFITLMGGAGLSTLAITGCSSEKGGGGASAEESWSDKEEGDYTVSAEEAKFKIESLELPHLQKGLDIDPVKFIGEDGSQIERSSCIPVNANNLSDEGFAESLLSLVNTWRNYGWSKENLLEATELEFPIGQRDEIGSPVGGSIIYDYDKYIWENYMKHGMAGAISHDRVGNDGLKASERLAKWMLKYSGYYALGVEEAYWVGRESYPRMNLESVENGQFFEPGYDRNLTIHFSASTPSMTSLHKEAEYEGKLFVSTNKGADGNFEIALQDFSKISV